MKILLAGNGKMASAVQQACLSDGQIEVIPFFTGFNLAIGSRNTVAIHFGSGRQLLELLEVCATHDVPVIQGSTKLSTVIPDNHNNVIINAPNSSLPMVAFMQSFPDFALSMMKHMNVSIAESHQAGKKDVSGTARALSKLIDFDEETIVSVRDRTTQLALGVPEEYLDGHAYHDFVFTGQGVTIKVLTQVHGRATYAEGAIAVAERLVANPKRLMSGTYQLVDAIPLLWG